MANTTAALGGAREAVLFLSPHVPAPGGHGASMRAALHLDALAQRFDVHLCVIREAGHGAAGSGVDSDFIRARTVSARALAIDISAPPTSLGACLADAMATQPRLVRADCSGLVAEVARMWSAVGNRAFIHVFRLQLARVAQGVARACRMSERQIILDMDDFESESAQRTLALQQAQLGRVLAMAARVDLVKLRAFERAVATRFGAAFLCSQGDRRKFIEHNPGARIQVVPNGYQVPAAVLPLPHNGRKRLLYVGSLNYLPNIDAIDYLVEQIWLPFLNTGEFELMVAGRQAPAALIALCQRHGITLIQDPPEIEAVYAASDLLLVPLRIGGGTRIKILEAFGFGRPVVTTTIGAEGLDLDDGEHALFADTPEAFAQACRRVLGDEALAVRLVSAARGLLQQRFSAEEIGKAILAGYTMARGGAGQ